jgi:2-phosphosulfolactate phosphatase
VVFDVLRATSVMLTGLANGARGFIPVAEIDEALALRGEYPEALLAGERGGWRITAAQTGGVEFDLGNSPREYTADRVRERMIIATTTNGTRALRACAAAPAAAVGSFLNLAATAEWLRRTSPPSIALLCAGTAEFLALEDVLGAGALCDLLPEFAADDSADVARRAYRHAQADLLGAIAHSRNGRRLLAQPDLQADVALCLRRDACDFVATMDRAGVVRKTA